jgi:hypothetical protein
VSDLYTVFPESAHIFSCSMLNRQKIYKSLTEQTEHYNSVLELTVSFLGIHKWEPDIYIGFSQALHLQCKNPFVPVPVVGWGLPPETLK